VLDLSSVSTSMQRELPRSYRWGGSLSKAADRDYIGACGIAVHGAVGVADLRSGMVKS